MAQLKASVNQIQLTTNMIISGDTTTPWTDAYYPSAKAVMDKLGSSTPGAGTDFPIGSILITSTNENPSSKVGGTWELVDKEYKNATDFINSGWSGWTMAMTGSNPTGAEPGGWIARADHTLCLKLYFTTLAEIDGSAASIYHKLGDLSRPLSGVSEGGFPLTSHYGMAYAVDASKNSYLVGYQLDGSGTLTITSIYDKKKLPAQSQIQLHLLLTMSASTMLDSACDKFYWKRTA